MRVVFSDESGTNDKADEPNTVVTAILTDLDEQWPVLPEKLEEMFRLEGIDPARYELKGTTLMKDVRKARLRPSEKNKKFGDRAAILWASAFIELFRHKIPVFGAAINKAGFNFVRNIKDSPMRDISPYMAAFSDCLIQVDNYVHKVLKDEQVLWISDKAGAFEFDLKDALYSIRVIQQQNYKDVFPLLDFPEPHIAHITDTIYFGDSLHSRALQLADVCATTLAYHLREDPDVAPFFRMMNASLVRDVWPLFIGMDKHKPSR